MVKLRFMLQTKAQEDKIKNKKVFDNDLEMWYIYKR